MPSHTPTIRSWFNIDASSPRRSLPPPPPLLPTGRILWITGPSGSGKSSLLKQMRRQTRCLWIDVNRLRLPNRPVIDCFDDQPLWQILPLLSRLGLAEARTYLQFPHTLSTGQRFRLRLALAISRASAIPQSILAADEFAAHLDPLTASIVARSLRRAITPLSPFRALLAGSRDDLDRALAPDQTIRCDFGLWSALANDSPRGHPDTDAPTL